MAILVLFLLCAVDAKPKRSEAKAKPAAQAAHAFGEGEAAIGRKDFGAAVAAFRTATELNPRHAEAYAQLGNVLQGSGRAAEALQYFAHLEKLVTRDTLLGLKDPHQRFTWAVIFSNFGYALAETRTDVRKAVRLFEFSTQLSPSFAEGFLYLGNAHNELKNPAAAARAFDAGLALHPTHPMLNFQRAALLGADGEDAQAEALYRRALEAKGGDFPAAWTNLGTILQRRKDLRGAEEAFRRALAGDASLAEAWTNLGVTLQDADDVGGAIAACSRAVELNPRLAPAHNNLGRAVRFSC